MEPTTIEPVTDAELAAFCRLLQDRADAYYAQHYEHVKAPTFYADPKGKRYVRIACRDGTGGGSVVVFVERANGTIWYPAGWKGPTFNFSRGNIRDPNPLAWITPSGTSCATAR